MTRSKRDTKPHLLDLPDDVIYQILFRCDVRALGRMACTCRRLRSISEEDCVWRRKRGLAIMGGSRWEDYSLKEACRIGHNLINGVCRDMRVIHHRLKQIPWMQLEETKVWISQKNLIKCFKPYSREKLEQYKSNVMQTVTLNGDICRFRSDGRVIVSGSRKGEIGVHSCDNGKRLIHAPGSHSSDVQDVDFIRSTIVSGSSDKTVKVWTMYDEKRLELRNTLHVEDRVWSLAVNPDSSSFAVGSAGLHHIPALRIYDSETNELLQSFSHGNQNGAGVLHMEYESPHILYTCGYDTSIRMWDLRTIGHRCVLHWDDPYDSAVYCIKPDGLNSIFSGTARHGMVLLWDKRHATSEPVQLYYAGRSYSCNSPVYSLGLSLRHLYVALDRGLNVLDFSIMRTRVG